MPRNQSIGTIEAKAKVLDLIALGFTVKDAMGEVGRTVKTFDNWRAEDRPYAEKVDEARERRKRALAAGKDVDVYNLDFATWRKRFLGMDTYEHQQQWIDVLEGREPTDLHPSIVYEKGREERVLLNTPPFHAKSATITRDYITFRLCMNPNYRVIIVSKTQSQAKKFLYSIRQILTSSIYAELQAAYAPDGGFKAGKGEDSGGWTSNLIYLAGRTSAEKDPSVEALGIGGQIYGARADLIVLDDAVTLSNANEYEKQMTWINQEVSSRLKGGKLLVVGTRVAVKDLYSELRNGENYHSGVSPWTYLGQPCVLDFATDPKDWATLWPRSSMALDENALPDDDGMFDAWSGPALAKVRDAVSASTWALIYMQMAVAEDATFNTAVVQGSINRARKAGPLKAATMGHPRNGQEGMQIIGSIDPAGTGTAFILLMAVDRTTKMRYVMQCLSKTNTIPSWYAEQIETLTEAYHVNEWVIESNAYASWLIHDERIVDYCRQRGVRITPHYTSRNKQDPDFGVASMAGLFGTMIKSQDGSSRMFHNKDNAISLPDPASSQGVQDLTDQLITWVPGKRGGQLRQDGPMALWFAELRARAVLGFGNEDRQTLHVRNQYLSRGDQRRRAVIPSGSW